MNFSFTFRLKQLQINLREYATDSDFDQLSFSLTQPTHGSLIRNGDIVNYTPTPGFIGLDSFSFQVSDGLATSTSTISINVTNSVPKTNWKKTNEPAPIDEYWISPTETLDVGTSSGFSAKVVSGPQTGRVIRFDEKVHFGETDLAGYLGLGSPAQRAELIRKYGKIGGRSTLLENDFDADMDPLKVALVRNVDFGILELSDDGSFLYEPDPQHTGDQSFTYKLFDGIQ